MTMREQLRRFKAFGIGIALLPLLASVVSTTATEAASIQPSYELIAHVPVATLPVAAQVEISANSAPNTVIGTTRLESLDNYGWWGIVTVPAGAGTLCFNATGLPKSSTCVNPVISHQVWLDAAGVPYLSRVAAAKNIKVHLSTSSKTNRFGVLTVNGISQTQPFVKVSTSDFVAVFPVEANTTTFSIRTQSTKSKKLVDDVVDFEGNAAKLSEIYITNGLPQIYGSLAEQSNTVYIHYHRDDNVYKSWGLHTWYSNSFGGAATDTTWAKPKTPISSKPDSWGITFKIPMASFSSKLPYVIHKGDLKDPTTTDQYLDLALLGYEIWVESGKVDLDGNLLIAYPQLPGTDVSPDELSIADATALASDSPRSSFAADSIYFVMIDRYKNGDPSNDKGGINSTNRSETGYDPTDNAWSHGGDLAGLSDGCSKTDGTGDGLPRIKNLGFSAVWITPPFKQNFVQGGSAAYHGYWINDFTTIDPHWGTNAQFKSFVDCAHRLGMKVIVDIVMNHTGDVIYYRDGYYGFRNSSTSAATIPSWGTSIKAPSWLNDLSNYHNQGNIGDWGNPQQYKNGDFYGLDDIKTENDVVVNGFADVYSRWVNDFGVDGFRIDTAKHVDDQYFSKWWPKMLNLTSSTMANKNQTLFSFGEYFDSNGPNLGNYMRKYGLPSVLDFAFQTRAVSYAAGGNSSNLSEVFGNDNNFIAKAKSPYNLVTFLGNHDMGRVGYLLNQSGSTRAQSDLLAHDIMFLTRGIPSVYYGDEVGMIGNGGDKAARQDMFPTQVSSWRTEDRVFGSAISTGSALGLTTALTSRIKQLNDLRKNNPALATGSQTQRLADGNVLVLSRLDSTTRTEYLVAFNTGNTDRTVKVTTSTPSSNWQSLLTAGSVTSNGLAEVNITIPARSTLVYRSLSALPNVTSASVTLNANPVSNNQSIQLSAGVSGSDLGTVTFVARQADGSWQVLGSDDSRSYGMTWDYQPFVGAGLAKGTKVAIAAIYKSTSGTISVSAVKTITIN